MAPQPALAVVEYSTPAPQNSAANRAMIFALLGFIPFVPGILAIQFGRRGARDADADPRVGGRQKARTAVGLGVASVVVWTVLSILAVPAAIDARRQAQRVACMSNLRQMGMAAMMYATANRGLLPPNIDGLTTIVPATVFRCPACAGDPTKPAASTGAFGAYNYVYVGSGQDLSRIKRAMTVPLAYEPPTNHADGGINVLFMDGHVECLQGAAATALLQQVAAATTQPAAASPVPEVER